MSHVQQRQQQTKETKNVNHMLSAEVRLSRLHRLFKGQYNVTEPSLILEPYLYLGNCISAHDTHRLSNLGIRYVLNVAIRDVEVCPYYSDDVRTLAIDLRDDDRENIIRTFERTFAFIDEARRAKAHILVHCSHGQSRSPAIVVAYLMRTYNVSLEQCLVHVIKARPCVMPNDGFLKQLILYDRFLVDRRRQRHEAMQKQSADANPPTEIPIQHKPSGSSSSTKETVTRIPIQTGQSSVDESSKTTTDRDKKKIVLIDSSSMHSAVSNESIHFIPIQVQSTTSQSEKIKPVQVRRISNKDASTEKDLKTNTKGVKQKVISTTSREMTSAKSSIDITSSGRKVSSKRRPSAYTVGAAHLSPSPTSRSQSAHTTVRAQADNNDQSSAAQQWDFTAFYAKNDHSSEEQSRTKYIIEVYDKTTNRFIPVNC